MDEREYGVMYKAEDRHWWYRGMGAITRAFLAGAYPATRNLRILDAGCGTGGAIKNYLANYGTVTGVDVHPLALGFCRKRGISDLARGSVSNLPFVSASFDLVTSFEVLYERGVQDDLAAVREFFRVLARGGRLLLRLPAYDWMRGRHDRLVHTARRYTAGRIARLVEEAGMVVEHISYANTFLFPAAAIKRLGERVFSGREDTSDLSLNVGAWNDFLAGILTWEAPLASGPGLPFGLSVFCMSRKH